MGEREDCFMCCESPCICHLIKAQSLTIAGFFDAVDKVKAELKRVPQSVVEGCEK